MARAEALNWHGLLCAVRADYPTVYRTWFDALDPGELAGGELRVMASDPAALHYLRTHCTEAFTQAAARTTGHLIAVSFIEPDHGTAIAPRPSLTADLTQIPLGPDYTFAEFVVGPSNRLAHAACQGVCSQPGTLYNPLFLHGACGLGKTHLLQATCAELLRNSPAPAVIYVSCETFVNNFIRAIETGDLQAFRAYVRSADALVIDDVQFLASRESSQEELFHTFNALHQSRRQIILSADSPPAEIPTLEDRLVSRFNWGLVAQIDPPNRETRQAILQKKARLRGWEIPADILDYIAEHVDSNIRDLEGVLTKLITENQLGGKPLTLDTTREILRSTEARPRRPLQVSDILQVVSQHFRIRLQELLGRRRTRSVKYPRHVAMYLARKLTSLSLEEIGMHFDGRDHSTILHAERTIEAQRAADPEVADTLRTLTRQLLARP